MFVCIFVHVKMQMQGGTYELCMDTGSAVEPSGASTPACIGVATGDRLP